MTQFGQIELIYNQITNLLSEISSLIKDEEYSIASSKIAHKDKLIKQLSIAKKTTKLSAQEELKMKTMETTIKGKNDKMLAELQKLRTELAGEVKETKNKIKLNSAYEHTIERQGDLIDISE